MSNKPPADPPEHLTTPGSVASDVSLAGEHATAPLVKVAHAHKVWGLQTTSVFNAQGRYCGTVSMWVGNPEATSDEPAASRP